MGTDTLPIERPIRLAFAATILVSLLACAPALAQSAQKAAQPGQTRPQTKDAAAAPTAPSGDAALKQRVEQLEEQLVDMQVVVGTLELLARNGASPSPRKDGEGVADGADSLRVDALETQVRAMAAQIEQLSQQVRALGGQPKRTDAGADTLPPDTPLAKPGPSDAARFGSTTITAGTGDAIADVTDSEQPAPPGQQPPLAQQPPGKPTPDTPPQDAIAAATPLGPPQQPGATAGNPKQLYETAYGYLMQRNYAAAQTAFEEFLNRYPKDSLAGNAQYWLGEAHFVRGEYKAAAGAFLKGYKDYAGNARAADSLLKLAMSLDRLGQKDGACSSYSELSTRFPDAPDNVKMRAKSERQRIGCP